VVAVLGRRHTRERQASSRVAPSALAAQLTSLAVFVRADRQRRNPRWAARRKQASPGSEPEPLLPTRLSPELG
jgi:hypothetical protein